MVKKRSILSMLAAGLLLSFAFVGTTGCERNQQQSGDDEAEAVQAGQEDGETAEQAQQEQQGEEGAAAQNEGSDEAAGEEGGEAAEQATVGERAPDFTLTDASGEEHTLSDYHGQIVVLEWTSPECPYVQRHYEEETMMETYDELGQDEIVWLAIDSSHFNNPEDSQEFKENAGFDFPVLQDSEGEVGKMYGAKTTPHMYVIDEEGILRYNGAIDDDPRGVEEEDTNYVLNAVEALKAGEEIEKKTTEPYGCSVKYGS